MLKLLMALAVGALPAAAQSFRLSAPAPLAPAPVFLAAYPSLPFAAPVPALVPSYSVRALAPVLSAPASAAAPLLLSAAPQPAAAAAEPAPERYDELFDGVPPRGPEGESVSPRLAAPGQATLRLPLQAAIVRGAVERALPALRESVALGSWSGPRTTLDESCCGDAAPKLAALLRARGIPARLVEAEFHYYVILDLPEGQLIVDPTIRQFFGKKGAPKSVPAVFVGTISELRALFLHHQAAKTTRYDHQRIYFSEAETREDELRRMEAAIRLGGPRDLEPLRRHLGLPPAPPAPREPPRLVVP